MFGAGALFFWASTLKIPDFDSFNDIKVIQSTKIYDRTGKILLWDIHHDIRRTVVPFDKISRNLKNATVAIEDSNFYNHNGIDFKAIARAFLSNLRGKNSIQGGSTISQQLIKNAFLTREKSYARKIKEAILTLKLEKKLSKEKILDLYLNEIPYGGVNYGIEAASQSFFGKHASDLTLAESAYLAALPQSPTYYSPYGNNREELEKRKNLVLERMLKLGFITKEEKEAAEKEKVKFIGRGNQSIKAPHFSIFIRSYLEKKYGKDMVERGGLKVITTLNYDLQRKAEEITAKYAKINFKKFGAKNAAMVVIDPKTGQILSMVGSKDYFDVKDQGNFNVTLARRQPGSAIKPFIYAAAFEKGYTPDTVVFDLKTEFNSSCNPGGTPKTDNPKIKCYMPQNSDGRYRGPLTFRDALAQSLNVPSVKVLYLTGLKRAGKVIRDMGITTLSDLQKYGLTLVLGGGEVTLLEMTDAYSAFANKGVRNPYTGILKVEDSKGNVLEQFSPHPEKAIDKNIALLVTDILSDNKARTPMFGAHSPLHIDGYDVAVKTGTTNEFKDAWVVGYSPNIAVGVWVGNNDNTQMKYETASFIAAPFWNAFMKEVLPMLPKERFEKPLPQPEPKPFLRGEWRGGKTYSIDKISGKLATKFTPPELIEKKTLTQPHSILYWINKDDPLGPAPENPENDPQFWLWETPVREWAKKNNIKDETMGDVPREFDDVHKPEYAPKISVKSPTPAASYNPRNIMNIRFSSESKFGLEQVDFFLNDTYLGSSNKRPFEFSFVPSGVLAPATTTKPYEIRIVAYDKVRNKSVTVVPVKFKF